MNIKLISICYLIQGYISKELLGSLCKWSISFDNNILFLAELNSIFVYVERMALNLIHNRLQIRRVEQLLEMSDLEVGDTGTHDLLRDYGFLESLPHAMSILNILGILRIQLGSAWPEKEHAVKVAQIHTSHRCFDNALSPLVVLEAWRNLRAHEVILSGKSIHEEVRLDFFANPLIILVETRGIEMSVACIQG